MLAPVRWTLGIGLHTGLLGEGLAEHLMQFAHRFVVALLGGVDGLLGQIVAQHIQRVDRVHAGAACGLGYRSCAGGAGAVVGGPLIEAGQIDKVVTQAGHGLLGSLLAQLAEEQRVIHRAALHQLQQALHQALVAGLGIQSSRGAGASGLR